MVRALTVLYPAAARAPIVSGWLPLQLLCQHARNKGDNSHHGVRATPALLSALRAAYPGAATECLPQARKNGLGEKTAESLLPFDLPHREACVAALVSKRVTLERSPSAVSVDPRYLVFELTASVVLRDQQLELVRTFRQALRDKSGLVHQMVMGAGKTTVVAPLLALCLADGDTLVTAVAPRSTALASAAAFAAAKRLATSRPKSTAQDAVASSTASESHEALNEDKSASPLVDSNARAQRAKSTAGFVRASDRRTASRRSPALARASTA